MQEITNQIYYVGVNDRNKNLFEGLWPLPNGVSYNSYLIDDDKVCLVDTVEVDFFVTFIQNIHDVIGDRPIDYLVINHMEPDHSGSLALIKKYYPNIQIIGNKKTFGMMSGFYGIDSDTIEVKTGSTIELGHHTLNFVLTPMVHWPETMVTLESTTHTLFSGDAFGCFGAFSFFDFLFFSRLCFGSRFFGLRGLSLRHFTEIRNCCTLLHLLVNIG